ncbi:MAG: hypothetical protein IIB07_09000, partial [Bacteroidetes bacterium]|nr:hypothetical protein [Bacteroidota bacterium]
YYDQYLAYLYSDVIIFNSAKYRAELSIGRKPLTEVDIIDEADEFLDSFFQQNELNLTRILFALKNFHTEYKKVRHSLEEMTKLIEAEEKNKKVLGVDENKVLKVSETKIKPFLEEFISNLDLEAEVALDELNYLNRALEIAREFKGSLDNVYMTYRKDSDNNILVKLVSTDISGKFKDLLNKTKNLIFMSGTLHSEEIIKNISVKDFLKLNEDDLNDFLDTNSFPLKYNAVKILNMVRKGTIKPKALVDYLSDANQNLFDTPVIGAEIYRSDDGGKTWKKTNKDFIDNMFYTYGYYFGEIRVNPNDDKRVYILGVPALHSVDGGKTFKSIGGENVHADYHALWINPNKDGHLIIGNDGGINITYDNGKHWFKANTPAVGQFYSVAVDNEKPYNVYGGLQDNGVWYGPSTYTPNNRWYSSGQYPFKFILGGDGMQVNVDTTNNKTVYTGFQFGNYYRVNKKTRKNVAIKPMPELGKKKLRFNWQSPIHLSNHNADIFYIGSNKLHRSLNKGDDYKTISFDLTKGWKKGDVPFGTLTTIDESTLQFGLLYTGSDDGLVYVSKDGGAKWENISKGLPVHLWVSRVTASSHKLSRIYVSLNGYRLDDFNSYLFSSDDYGVTWNKIGTNLPAEPINVVKEDPYNKNILYVGTDHGLYVSLDRGKIFMALFNGMPAVPVHDLAIQKRDKDLVVGTHGRSIYIVDIEHIEELNESVLSSTIHLFPVKNKKFSERWGNKYYAWGNAIEPSVQLTFFSKKNVIAEITIKTNKGLELANIKDTCEIGLNFVSYDLSIDKENVEEYKEAVNSKKKKVEFKKTDNGKTYLHPGSYIIEINIDGVISSQNFKIGKPRKRKRR